MGNRYLVVSDLHLVDIEDHEDGWKAYKSSRYVIDEPFDALVKNFTDEAAGGDRLTLILNGDIIEFDMITAAPTQPPWPVSRHERKVGLDPTEEKSAWKLRRVLDHHPEFISTLARFISAGHRVVYIMGNHDREFHFQAVQDLFIAALEKRAQELEISLTRGSMEFEPWFYYVQDEIYVEHGHQYDHYNSFKYLLHPVINEDGKEQLALPMGNLANRVLMSRMGYFNPHCGGFILGLFHYAWHWMRFYSLSRRSLVLPWFFGSLWVVSRLLRMKKLLRLPPPEHLERLREVGRSFDLTPGELEALGQLQRTPITQRLFRILHEFWIDRVIVALLMTGSTITLALVPIPLWIKLMVPLSTFPLLWLLYEMLSKGENIFVIETELPQRARALARVLPARLVVLGHTHVPRQIPISKDTDYIDTGTWAPLWPEKNEGGGPLKPGYRNYLSALFQRKNVTYRLGSWME